MTRRLPWLLPALLAVAAAELGAHAAILARVAQPTDYRAAAAFVAQRMGSEQAVSAAPAYIDPLVRQALGNHVDLADAGRSDLAAYRGLWGISLRDARPTDAPANDPDLTQDFGQLRVHHWSLPAPTVRFDFTAEVARARVSQRRGNADRACPRVRTSAPRGGGLGKGVLPPAHRFECDRGHFVAAVVMEDLNLQPRHCVWQPPTGNAPLRVRFDDVPLGDRLVLYGGLYYEHERMREGPPVDLSVRIDGELRGNMHHRDGDGWKRIELATGGGRGEVTFEVTSATDRRRGFCWAASTREGP